MKLLKSGKANVVIGGQFGSEGKGKTYGYIYQNENVTCSVCDFTPNAGHTCFCSRTNGEYKKVVSKVLPMGAWFGSLCVVGPHAVFDKTRLLEEIDDVYDTLHVSPSIFIHPNANVLEKDDVLSEKTLYNHISSTMQGSCEAVVKKMRRDPNNTNTARHLPESNKYKVSDTHSVVNRILDNNGTVLIETAQGFDLGLNNGAFYPYSTSRDCMVGRALDNAGVSPRRMGNIIGVIRTFPIRVGNTDGGCSGSCYPDQREITWEDVSAIRGIRREEYTTVTKRLRRVFTFGREQLIRFLDTVRPNYLVINFVDYLDNPKGWKNNTIGKFISRINKIAEPFGSKVVMAGTGEKAKDYITC